MAKSIVKHKGYYIVWSSIVDAPIHVCTSEKELIDIWREEYGESGVKDLTRFGNGIKTCSLSDVVAGNRAGPNESELTEDEIYRVYCLYNKHNGHDEHEKKVVEHWNPVDFNTFMSVCKYFGFDSEDHMNGSEKEWACSVFAGKRSISFLLRSGKVVAQKEIGEKPIMLSPVDYREWYQFFGFWEGEE